MGFCFTSIPTISKKHVFVFFLPPCSRLHFALHVVYVSNGIWLLILLLLTLTYASSDDPRLAFRLSKRTFNETVFLGGVKIGYVVKIVP